MEEFLYLIHTHTHTCSSSLVLQTSEVSQCWLRAPDLLRDSPGVMATRAQTLSVCLTPYIYLFTSPRMTILSTAELLSTHTHTHSTILTQPTTTRQHLTHFSQFITLYLPQCAPQPFNPTCLGGKNVPYLPNLTIPLPSTL